MKFPYKKIPIIDPQTRSVVDYTYRPIIPIKLKYESQEIEYEVLIDSGADDNVFHAEIGEIIGLEVKSSEIKKTFLGIGGAKVIGYQHRITIEVGGHKFNIKAYFAYNLGPSSYGVLGQRGFFDLFRIRFIYSKKSVEITPERRGKS